VRAALLSEYHRPLDLVERPVPEPVRPRDVVVRIGGAGVCATDLHAIDGLMEPAGLRPPVVLGHENAGWVHAVGDGVIAAKVGDTVVLHPPYTCGICVPCRRGQDMHCIRHGFTGLTRDGGFADYVLVDERSLVPLPPGIEPVDVAPHSDAGITAMHAVKRLLPRLGPGTSVALIGVGGVGHIALQLVKALGGATVVAIDTDERRRELARELGADEVIAGGDAAAGDVREFSNGSGVDAVIDFVGTDATHFAGVEMLARGGVYSTVGYGGTVSVPSVALVAQDLTVEGNLVGNWIDLWELLQLHARGEVVLRKETHPLEDVNEVLQSLREGEVTGRAVLVP
jgi:D-arabinose 1-dehydrogenase-like Zn-dependent alcohol dehydrogenase